MYLSKVNNVLYVICSLLFHYLSQVVEMLFMYLSKVNSTLMLSVNCLLFVVVSLPQPSSRDVVYVP